MDLKILTATDLHIDQQFLICVFMLPVLADHGQGRGLRMEAEAAQGPC